MHDLNTLNNMLSGGREREREGGREGGREPENPIDKDRGLAMGRHDLSNEPYCATWGKKWRENVGLTPNYQTKKSICRHK